MPPAPTLDEVNILVLGDVNLDTIIVPLPRQQEPLRDTPWHSNPHFWRHRRRGGAWLLADMICAAVEGIKGKGDLPLGEKSRKIVNTRTYPVPPWAKGDALRTRLPVRCLSSSAILGLFPRTPSKKPEQKDMVYRIDKFLGWVHNNIDPFAKAMTERYSTSVEHLLSDLHQTSDNNDVLVLHDTATHFRNLDKPVVNCIKRRFRPDHTWIVWHMYSPLATGKLWAAFKANGWLKRTIVVVKADCLRHEGAYLPENTCLEQESHNFRQSINLIPCLKDLATAQHLVVHFHRQGALHHEWKKGLTNSCFYCPNVVDDSLSPALGTMIGFTSVLVATIVRGLASSLLNGAPVAKGILHAIKQGVVLDRLYYLHGYGGPDAVKRPVVAMPYPRLFEKLALLQDADWKEKETGKDYTVAAIPFSKDTDLSKWSRINGLIDRCPNTTHPPDDRVKADQVAFEIVRHGLEHVVLADADLADNAMLAGTPGPIHRCPYKTFGKLQTAYGTEIDSFSSIRRIFCDYINDKTWLTPLSIAVFGKPGSGKSFTVKQILESIDPNLAKRPLEFNLAQFGQVPELQTAFHKVQDETVSGEIPLVFFDEFDAKDLSWLSAFLAPMQDGTFKAGESMYRIGRAIFVFAGGILTSWEELRTWTDKKLDMARKVKMPDFISRLRGYLDIQTINAPDETIEKKRSRKRGNKARALPNDGNGSNVPPVLIVRRAILLRSLLEAHLPEIIDPISKLADINRSVVRAFVQVDCYKHEARSMQAVIEMCQVSRRKSLQPSSLPSIEQLKIHVDPVQFHGLMKAGL